MTEMTEEKKKDNFLLFCLYMGYEIDFDFFLSFVYIIASIFYNNQTLTSVISKKFI